MVTVTVTDRYADGHLAFGPGIRQFLLSHSHAMYYSPSQWCSVGYVIHNLKLPNLKHIISHMGSWLSDLSQPDTD